MTCKNSAQFLNFGNLYQSFIRQIWEHENKITMKDLDTAVSDQLACLYHISLKVSYFGYAMNGHQQSYMSKF